MMTKPENYLLAIGGDCSAGAMSEHAEVLPVEEHNYELVADFLRVQNEWTIASHFNPIESKHAYDKLQDFWKACSKLKNANIFQHKWHSRTEWRLVYEDELSNLDKPHKIYEKELDERYISKSSTRHWLCELFGIEFNSLHKFKVVDNWLFFNSDDFEEDESETMVYMVYTDTIIGELYMEWKEKDFDWNFDKLRLITDKANAS
tara:strand:+ start:276 stop:887 length:612 start_codon:yes stop_codon:yes gene_type:complete